MTMQMNVFKPQPRIHKSNIKLKRQNTLQNSGTMAAKTDISINKCEFQNIHYSNRLLPIFSFKTVLLTVNPKPILNRWFGFNLNWFFSN